MIDTSFCRYRCIRKHRIPISGNLLYKHIAILCQKTHSFHKKIAARLLPRRMVQNRHGAEHVGFPDKLRVFSFSRIFSWFSKIRARYSLSCL